VRRALLFGMAVVVIAALAVGIVLVSRSTHSPSTGSKKTATTSAGSSTTTTGTATTIPATSTTVPRQAVQVVLTNVSCPSTYAISGLQAKSAPATMRASVPAGSASSYEFYSLSNGDLAVLAPARWKCQASAGVDGSAEVVVVPPSEQLSNASVTTSADPEAVTALTTGGCQGCAYDATCAYLPSAANQAFPAMAQSPGCDATVPRGESTGTISQNVAYFEDPPGVIGHGDSSGGSNPANGIIVLQPPVGGEGDSFTATCTLPESEHAACTTILNEFEAQYPT